MKKWSLLGACGIALVEGFAWGSGVDVLWDRAEMRGEVTVERVTEPGELEELYRLNPDLEEVEGEAFRRAQLTAPPGGRGTGGPLPPKPDPALVALDRIVNLGERIWTLVERNRPVTEIGGESASALPHGISHWSDLEYWQTPKMETYRIRYVNFFGVRVVSFTVRLLYTWGGSVDGVGRYLANITVIPAHVDVKWGFRFNALTEVADVVNVNGREFPIAGAEIHVRWSLESVFRKIHQSAVFFVKGNGEFEVIGSPDT